MVKKSAIAELFGTASEQEEMRARDIFRCYGISEEDQERILKDGVNFDFGINKKKYDSSKFADFLTFCMDYGFDFDANYVLHTSQHVGYMDLVDYYESLEAVDIKKRERIK